MLFVPSKRERGMLHIRTDHGLRLYSRKILIQNANNDLLPDYFRFIDGVVDSDDLPLNVSREMVQSNPVMRQIRRALASRLNREFKTLAEEQPERYAEFWSEFGAFLKQGAATDSSNQEVLVDLLRFHTSKRVDAWASFNDYIADMAEGQDVIYYVLGEDLRSITRSPHLDPFRARGLEVLYLVDPIDGFLAAMLREVHGKPLQNVDDAGLSLPEREQTEPDEQPQSDAAEFSGLVARVTQVLGERVRGVQESKQLVQSPCRLVSPADDFDRDLQRLRRLTEEDYTTPKKLLELNPRHPTIANLAHMVAATPDDPVIDASIEQLFDNALLLEGLHANPVDMVERIQMLLDAAVAGRVKGE
jgi:molecular chaperone HtpG